MNKTVLTSFTILCLLSTVFLIALNIQPVKASGTSIEVSPNTTVNHGSSFSLNITINNVKDMHAWEVEIRFRKIIKITSVVEKTNLLDGSLIWVVDPPMLGGPSYNYYKLSVGSFLTGRVSGVTGSGVVAQLNFTTVYNGTTQIEIMSSEIVDPNYNEISHTCSSCNITVLGINEQYFLNIIPPSHGTLNVTSGTYIYDNGTNVAIEATETTGAFRYIKVDTTMYTTKTIVVTMNSDHEVSALFQIPILTIHTSVPNVNIWLGDWLWHATNSIGYLVLALPRGTYTLEAAETGYYSVTQSINLTDDTRIDIQMNRVLYVIPTAHITPTDAYLVPFMPQNYSTCTFYATIPWSGNWTDLYYVDAYGLIWAQPVVDTTERIQLIVQHRTDYPIIEIESSNTAVIRFNLTELYKLFGWNESYLEKIERTQFTGFKLDSNVPIVFELGMPEPKELWKITPEGTMTKLTDWSYENSTVLLSFEPGDPTISMIFGDNSTNYDNLLADFALNTTYASLDSSYNNLQANLASLNLACTRATSVTLDVGQSQTFTSTVFGGTSPYTYQWYLNGNPVPGATNATWTFTPSSAGPYTVYVKVTDSVYVQATSNTATVISVIQGHDVAVINATSSKTIVDQGFSANLTVTVINFGNYTETFKVTAYADATPIASQNVTLTSGNSATITFVWNTTGFAYGNYTISAYAWPVPGETHTADNTFIDGIVTVTIPVHDVAVTNVTSSKTVVGQGFSDSINVTAANQGNYTETFNVTLYANTTAIATQTITLTSGNSTTITFMWNTAGFAKGNYTISAYAIPVPGETDTADNTLKASIPIEITILGDVDGNHVVNIQDVVKIAAIYASKQGDPNFNPDCDLDNDGKITILDLVTCTVHYGEKWNS